MNWSGRMKVLTICTAFFIAFSPLTETRAQAATGKFNMSYIYFGSSSVYTDSIDRTNGSLNEISPSYFDLNADGSLKLTTAANVEFVREMHVRGIRVTPFLSNHWNRTLGRTALSNRAALAKQLADAVAVYALDGVNLDLENLTEADRAAYTDFVRLLRAQLPASKTISVSVAANPWGASTGWQGSYDYAGLAGYSDYLMIMAYDEHYQSGPAGAVASLSFTEKSVQYALKTVPKEKIVLGLPFYGRIWKNGGGYPQGYGISNRKIDELVRTYGGKVIFDAGSQTPYAQVTIKTADAKPVIGGTGLSAGSYTIWYENEQSIKQKLTLVDKYDIKGTGSWSLGQETDKTWDYYRLWLNGCYFADVQGHWAQDTVLTAFQNGWVEGVTSVSFRPDAPLTRAQAAVILVRALKLSPKEQSAVFSDTAGHWAQAEIETVHSYGLVNGVGENRFSPDTSITREQMAVLLNNMRAYFTQSPGAGQTFTDVSPETNPWSYEAVSVMSGMGILQGFPDGSFKPQQVLTRAQMTVLVARLMADSTL